MPGKHTAIRRTAIRLGRLGTRQALYQTTTPLATTMTPNCNYCGHPATHYRITDFAGTYYTCNYHWNQLDSEEQDAYLCIQTREESQDHKANTSRDTQRLLDKLQEEAAEVIQAVSKIRRFGPHNHHPLRTQTNLQELVGELEDFQAIVWALEEINYFDPKPSTASAIKKFNARFSS